MTDRVRLRLLLILAATFFAAGCERFGIQDPAKVAAEQTAEGKAIGAGCRHAGRSIEDCFSLNDRAPKAAVFDGWKEMNDYMASNKIDAAPSQLAQAPAAVETQPAPVPQVKAESGKSKAATAAAPAAAPPGASKH